MNMSSHFPNVTSSRRQSPLPSGMKRRQHTIILLHLLFCMIMLISPSAAQSSSSTSSQYFYFCDLSRRPVVTLYWNETAREYQEEEEEEENNSSINNNTQGNLRHLLLHRPQPPQSRNEQDDKQQQQEQQQLRSWNDMDLSSLQEAIHPAATTTSRIYGGGINTAWNTTKAVENDASTATKGENEAALLRRPRTIEVRICPCAESHPAYPDYKYYCPTDRAYCAVPGVYPSSGSTYAAVTPVCLNLQNDEIFVRSVWPIILIWFALAAVFCLCTYPGRNAIDYVLATCFPCYNKRVVDSILQSHQSNNNNSDLSPVSRHAYQRRRHLEERYRYLVRDHQVVDGGLELAERRLFEYQLKTKRYHRIPAAAAAAPKDDNDDGENAIVAAPSELGPVATNAETTSTSTAIANSASNAEEMTCQPIDAPLPVVSSSPSGSLLVDNDNNNNDDSNNDDEGEADDELDEHACSICFVPLEDGDRVGALPCQHVFHVDCLKGWLKRRNVCPLCMQGNIATPRVPPTNMGFPIIMDHAQQARLRRLNGDIVL